MSRAAATTQVVDNQGRVVQQLAGTREEQGPHSLELLPPELGMWRKPDCHIQEAERGLGRLVARQVDAEVGDTCAEVLVGAGWVGTCGKVAGKHLGRRVRVCTRLSSQRR